MKIVRSLAAAAVAALLVQGGSALADEKFQGTVAKIGSPGPGGAVVTLMGNDGKTVDVTVDDAITLEKFKDGRIGVGDLVKAKYEVRNGKNHATYLKKPAGC